MAETGTGFIDLGPELFADDKKEVISWQGMNFYRACDQYVSGDEVNGPASFCVKRVHHPGPVCEDYAGRTICNCVNCKNHREKDGGSGH